MICPLCDREIAPGEEDKHHLIPKTFRGKEVVPLHKICHRKIHATFTERELLQHYHTIERLREHDVIQSFIQWVKNKPIDFYVKTKETKQRKGKRRR